MPYTAGINENLIDALKTWFDENLPGGKAKPSNGALCLGSVAYGSYVDTLLDYCLPSLMAEGNLPALHGAWLIIYTDDAGEKKIKDSDIIKKLEDRGIIVSCAIFSALINDCNK